MFTIPVSRKVVAGALAAGVFALLRTVGVVETSPDLTAWITTGAALATGLAVSEGTKFVNYFLEKKGLPVRVEDEA